jgi:predicted acetyltransferase
LKDLFLTKPNKEYQKSFGNYVLAYEKSDAFYFDKYKKGLENFTEYIKELDNYSKGIDLPQGEITTSNFWLIDNNEVVGITRIRHQGDEYSGHIGYDIGPCYRNRGYGTQILKLALKEAGKLGIKNAIVTCSTDNIPSRKIIEKNNGELLGVIFDEEENEHLYKYSIATSVEIL